MAENWNRGSQPTETTRLLSQSVKLANENEAIGELTYLDVEIAHTLYLTD